MKKGDRDNRKKKGMIAVVFISFLVLVVIVTTTLYNQKDFEVSEECFELCRSRGAMYGRSHISNNTELCTCVYGDYIGNIDKVEFFEKQDGEFIKTD